MYDINEIIPTYIFEGYNARKMANLVNARELSSIFAKIKEAASKGEYAVEVKGMLTYNQKCALTHAGYSSYSNLNGEESRTIISWNT